jgi:hypothetical protein
LGSSFRIFLLGRRRSPVSICCNAYTPWHTSRPASCHDALEHGILGVDDAARRRADADIVREDGELEVEDVARPHPADRDARPLLEVAVEPGLRPVLLVVDKDGVLRRGGAAERLRGAGVGPRRRPCARR